MEIHLKVLIVAPGFAIYCLGEILTRCMSLQEFLAETKDKRVVSRKEWFQLICLRIFTNFISIALIACATYLIVEVVAGYPVEVSRVTYHNLQVPISSSACTNIIIRKYQYHHLHVPISSSACANIVIRKYQYHHLQVPL